MAYSRPSSGLTYIQTMSSPTVVIFQPALRYLSGGMSMAKLVLPQALGWMAEHMLLMGVTDPRGDVGLLAARVGDAHEQHVLGHPPLLEALVAGQPQGQALLAQQRVA